ncbi:hypothetical protein HWV62_38729 [Athelia sp. TMB]|nr:hypothetical protein HWV62_38729 [Athelia sp. TMB]
MNAPPSSSKYPASLSQPSPALKMTSCISPSSAFFQVLTAPYRPLALSTATQSMSVAHATASTSSEEHRSYISQGRWAWADGLTIEHSEELLLLACEYEVTAPMPRVLTLGAKPHRYVLPRSTEARLVTKNSCTSASAGNTHRKTDFTQRSEAYLCPLQGLVVSSIIGVHVLPGAISIAMELPHHSFWIEASPGMPSILKQRCVEAFAKIHERGVLHGDVELHNMLIGGDGRVTIINFQNSRALIPNLDITLMGAEAKELELEMRRVKYKLDYEGAREKELMKMTRAVARTGRVDEDGTEPAVDAKDWAQSWANTAANAIPTRFVVPGQTQATIVDEVRNFLESLDGVASLLPLRGPLLDNGPRQVRFASELASTRIFRAASSENALDSPTDSSPRKRKLPENPRPYNTRSSKRLRPEPTSEEDDEPVQRGLVMDPVLAQYLNTDPSERDHFTPPRSIIDEASASQPATTSQFPPIKIRDFAYEPYDGPKGHYVPCPLVESVMALNRRRWIHQQTAAARQRAASSAYGEAGPSTAVPTPPKKQSLTDKHLRRLMLGLNEFPRPAPEARRPSLFDPQPHASSSTADQRRSHSYFDPKSESPSSPPVIKRKRGDRDQEMGQEDFDEDDRLAKIPRTVTRAEPTIAVPSAASSSAQPGNALQPATVSSEDHKLIHMGPRTHEFTPPPVRPSPKPRMGSKKAALSDRLAFATLRRLAPASSALGATRAVSLLRAVPLHSGTPSERNRARQVRLRSRSASPDISSEDEVEGILAPPVLSTSLPSVPSSSFTWMSFLLRWIQ